MNGMRQFFINRFGEIADLNFCRDKETGKSLGYGFIKYEDQRSTVLAVDNFNGTKVILRSDFLMI